MPLAEPGPLTLCGEPDVARVPYLGEHDLAEQDRELLERPINLFRALANNVGALRQWASFGDWVRWHGSIDPRRRELAIIQVGLSARSPYEVTHHVEISRGFGVTEADLDDLARLAAGQQSHQLSAVDLAVVNAARELTERGSLAAATWTALVDGVGQPDAVEFVVVMGFYTMVTGVLSALEIDVEPDYEQHLAYFRRAARL
jgi:alkylhydroperoxidase family enzyme